MPAASAIAKTRAFALLIKEKPSILQDPEELKLIRSKLDVDELHVSDASDKLIASLVHDSYHGMCTQYSNSSPEIAHAAPPV